MHCYISLYITGFFTSLQSTFIYIISLFDRTVGECISEVAVITVVWYIHLASSCYSRALLQQRPPLPFLLHCFPLFHAHWMLPFSTHISPILEAFWPTSPSSLSHWVSSVSASSPLHLSTNCLSRSLMTSMLLNPEVNSQSSSYSVWPSW